MLLVRAIAFGLVASASHVVFGQSVSPPSFDPSSDRPPALVFPELPDTSPAEKAPTPGTPPAVAPPVFRRPEATTPVIRQPVAVLPRPQRLPVEQTAGLPKHVQKVIDFYGGATSGRALAQLPHRPSTGVAHPPQVRQNSKPFEGSAGGPPTLSPYLNLFIDQENEVLPNYHAYVRPVIRQQATNSANRQQLHTLQNKVRTVSYEESARANGSVPATGHGTRYLNTSRFYPTTRRLK